jgi:hypothetical protein
MQIDAQRPKLAAAETTDVPGHRAIEESFVAGFRVVVWIAVMFGLAGTLSAGVLIKNENDHER